MSGNKSKFGWGLLLGTILGGLGALFLSPKSGKENRELVAKKIAELEQILEEKELDKVLKDIFGEANKETKKILFQAKEKLINKLANLKGAIDNIDKDKFRELVEEVVDKLQFEAKREVKEMIKLKEHLFKEWYKLQKNKNK